MQHDHLTMKLESAVSFLKNDPLAELALRSCQQCGMTYLPLLQQLSRQQGLKHGAASLRRALKELTVPVSGVSPMLQDASLRIFGRSGAPTAVFIPTEFGRQVLERLKIKCPNPHNEAARKHLYIQMELVTRALQTGWTPTVEKHLATLYAGYQQVIRIDVFIERPGEHNLYLEAEQELTSNNFSRAEGKFEHWQRFGAEQEETPHFWIVFNAPRKTLQQTIQTWRKALAHFEEPNFRVWYCPLSDLADVPLEEALHSRFLPLEPLKEEKAVTESDPKHLSLLARQLQDYELDWNVWDECDGLIFDLEQARVPAEKLPAFLALMRFIHARTDLQADSYGYKYNAPPLMALSLLHKYLTLPDNLPMYEELGQAIRWAQGRGSMGVTMMKQVYTNILWDVVLAHHGFAREGQLKVDYKIADHLATHQQSGVEVTYDEQARHGHKSENEAALEWVLNALFLYAEPLGLGRLPWKK